jgi:predicted ATPase
MSSKQWPAGATVRVRMGIHTGNPTVHDGGYVGMDVHRAARIAGAAHGGQVVVSAATAELIGAALPADVRLRDLGSFRLKDLPLPERLFQLTGANLLDGFPPLKTFGSASSLPRPATDLVGRNGELAELTALLSAGARLVTLTGPGGSGKTRLAIGVAAATVDRYPDGVFFAPLAAVTTAEVMWTTIAQVLDVPPEARTPPALFTHVAQRRALFVLDNLEQIAGADTVVADLLREAPHTAVIAATRRPLHLAAEHEHPVPPLELPDEDDADVTGAQASGAVQLFVQQARKVKPSFMLTADNVADVTALCRRLDGLPLAIELAAARSKLLSPRALLTRLDQALDIKEAGIDKPARQQTLRAAIDWSYDVLTKEQQAFFRRLGVFAGGADLDAIPALTAELDALDMLTDLVDASLITISEDPDGEPRVALLETIRAYARDQLGAHGELDATSQAHAEHYLNLSQQLQPLMLTQQRKAIRARFQAEHDNIRAALEWALRAPTTSGAESNADDEHRVRIGLGLCAHAGGFWRSSGYSAEGLGWVERAIGRAGEQPWLERAECLREMGTFLHGAEQFERAHLRDRKPA